MRNAIYEQKGQKGMTVKIYADDSPESPREWDNLGTIVYLKSSRYTLGDKGLSSEEIDEIAQDSNNIVLPVYAYIHGSVMLKAGNNPFTCPWDSGQSGLIYVSKDKVKKEYGELTNAVIESVVNQLKCEVDTFSKFLQGEVYGYVLEDADGNDIDSCWGFYDTPEQIAEQVLKDHADHIPETISFEFKTEEAKALLHFCNGTATHDEKLLVRQAYMRLDAKYRHIVEGN